MNLYDLVLRRDRMVDAGPEVRARALKERSGTLRAVHLPDGVPLRLIGAHAATALRSLPSLPHWRVHADAGSRVEIWLESGARRHTLFNVEPERPIPRPATAPRRWWAPIRRQGPAEPALAPTPRVLEVTLAWPLPVPPTFDLHMAVYNGSADISVGPLLDARARLLPLLRGRGVEVGPGLNPAVHADDQRSVTYVEKLTPGQWAANYAKQALDPAAQTLWNNYVIDSAQRLDSFADGSLDFIFSSHVLEHLVDPLGVLERWWGKLAPGGVIAGVVPDARFSFDLRQPLTSLDGLLDQRAAALQSPTAAMYEQWCRHTAIGSTPDSLRARDYAIHVSYFSPDVFAAMLQAVAGIVGTHAGVFIEAVCNGKDFGFAVVKP